MHKKIIVTLNGIKQGMFLVENKDKEKPVLLFLHGGPGSPEYSIMKHWLPELHDHFTVCYPDQRGSGLSCHNKLADSDYTVEHIVADTIAVAKFLKRKYKKEKLYVLGHSWGSYLGVKLVQKAPEHFVAYLGVGQVANQLESERETYYFILENARKAKDKKLLKGLQGTSPTKEFLLSNKFLKGIRQKGNTEYGGGFFHNKKVGIGALIKSYREDYNLRELASIAFSKPLKIIFPTLLDTALWEGDTKFEIPVYIFQGRFDYQTSHRQAEEFFTHIEAPHKEFFTFEHSAHVPIVEEKPKFLAIIKEILQETV